MLKKVVFSFMILLAMVSWSEALEIEGVTLPDSLQAGKDRLVLNGAGVRTKLFMDLYVAGLYLQNKSGDADQIINADEPMAIRLVIISKLISSNKMVSATEEGFETSTGRKMAPIQKEIDSFIDVFKEDISKKDMYDLVYIPGTGVEASKNGKLVKTIPGMEFKKAMFGIWLCKKPSHKCPALKKGMLGQ
jgi:hypothetical protein